MTSTVYADFTGPVISAAWLNDVNTAVYGTGLVFNSLTVSGNILASGTAQRFQADFSNATVGNRLLFQDRTTNSPTFLGAIPNGNSTTAALVIINNSNPANSSYTQIATTSTVASLDTGTLGSGTQLPWNFNLGGATWMSVATTRAITINAPTSGVALTVNAAAASYAISISGGNIFTATDGTVTSFMFLTGGISYFGNTSNHPLNLRTNALDRITIASGGAVTINTPASGTTLTVNGITGTGGFVYTDGTTSGYIIASAALYFGSSSNHPLVFRSNGTDRAQITAAGALQVNADAGGTYYEVGFRDLVQNPQGGTYTLVLADRGKSIAQTSGSAWTLTVPTDASVAFPIGTVVTVVVDGGGGAITISPAGGVTIYWVGTTSTTGARVLTAVGMATLYKYAANSWMISGTHLT